MTTYASNAMMQDVAARIRGAKRIALFSHARPDGDALGSLLALARSLPAPGHACTVFTMGEVEPPLLEIVGATPIRRVEEDPPGDEFDLVIVADTGAWSQLEPIADWLRERPDRTIVIDHHARGDDVGTMRVVEPTAAATAELMVRLLDALGCPLTGGTGGVAEALYLGIATDTGWFRYSNASADTFEVAARLVRAGVDKSRLYQLIEETHRPERLALEARALASVAYAQDGAVAIMTLTARDFAETGGTAEDLTGLVNRPMVVRSVRVSILLAGTEPESTKMSFRSKTRPDGEPGPNVNLLAQRFGGGGHRAAAGARSPVSLEETRSALDAVLEGPLD